jgi:hypothetical protein
MAHNDTIPPEPAHNETVTPEPATRLLNHSVLHFMTSVLGDDTTDDDTTDDDEDTDSALSGDDTDLEEERHQVEVVQQFRNLRHLLLHLPRRASDDIATRKDQRFNDERFAPLQTLSDGIDEALPRSSGRKTDDNYLVNARICHAFVRKPSVWKLQSDF